MIRKLFGETEEQQFSYLKPRLTALGIGGAIMLVGLLLMLLKIPFGEIVGGLGGGICVIVLLLFGWTIMRGLFGFVSVGSIFSGNVVIGVVIFVLFITIGYFGGFVVAFIGLCRFLVLLKKQKGND